MTDNYLITGGAGFIGTNLADYYLSRNKRVTILDNFSRAGNPQNLLWLKKRHGRRLALVYGDIRRSDTKLHEYIERAEVVFHLAAQVAVTTSVTDPREDFEINTLGTFNLMEAVRLSSSQPIVVYSSTNKVYGKMADLAVVDRGRRYGYAHQTIGIAETCPLEFCSPYGCSKGAADQYVLDYSRIYGLKTIVFRQSCIYGPHQFGMEDQGWVAWFALQAMKEQPVVIYGDGKQVRDVLYIDDLMAAYDAAVNAIARTNGQAYNIGGGPRHTLSLLELIDLLGDYHGRPLAYSFAPWRPGDQRIYISNIEKAKRDFNWTPRINAVEGIGRLLNWLKENECLFASPAPVTFARSAAGS